MLTLTYLYEITKKESYLSFIGEWADWIMEEKCLIRTGDGCFQHMITGNPNDSEILIDTLFMAVLFLARAGRLLNRPDYIEEAKYQVLCLHLIIIDRKEMAFQPLLHRNFLHKLHCHNRIPAISPPPENSAVIVVPLKIKAMVKQPLIFIQKVFNVAHKLTLTYFYEITKKESYLSFIVEREDWIIE